jgi:hypothetical protein
VVLEGAEVRNVEPFGFGAGERGSIQNTRRLQSEHS